MACGQHSDKFGDHAVGCASQGERISRHNHLRDALHSTAASAHLSPLKEQRSLLPGFDARPADIMLPNFAGGKDLALDVTVVNSLQVALVEGAAKEPGFALQHRHREKWAKYGEACQAEGVQFEPLCVEVTGGWGQGEVTIRTLGRHLARVAGNDEGLTIRHLFQRLAILLMRGNCQLILSRSPTEPCPAITGEK